MLKVAMLIISLSDPSSYMFGISQDTYQTEEQCEAAKVGFDEQIRTKVLPKLKVPAADIEVSLECIDAQVAVDKMEEEQAKKKK